MIDKLKKWLRGDADFKAQQLLEKSASDDAFLADALEGYRTVPEGDHEKSVETLKAKLRLQHKKDRKGIIVWKNIAAAAVVVLSVALVYWLQQDVRKGPIVDFREAPVVDEKPAEVATTQEKKLEIEEPKGIDSQTPTITSADPIAKENKKHSRKDITNGQNIKVISDELPDPTPVDSKNQVGQLKIAANEKATAPVAAGVTAPEIESADEIIADTELEDPVSEVAKDSPIKKQDDIAKKAEPTKSTEIRSISGKVTDVNGESIIAATIRLQGTEDGAVTDLDGNFTLTSDQSLPWELEVSSIGYVTQIINVSSFETNLNIQFEEAQALLSEVVVSDYKVKRKTESKASSIQSTEAVKKKDAKPAPKKGFKKYKRYIKKNLNYPEAARMGRVEGAVILRFQINAEGMPENISVSKSLGFGCDEEAIRLIKEGGKWRPAGASATFEVTFKL